LDYLFLGSQVRPYGLWVVSVVTPPLPKPGTFLEISQGRVTHVKSVIMEDDGRMGCWMLDDVWVRRRLREECTRFGVQVQVKFQPEGTILAPNLTVLYN
jgi:hypothetical protein